MTEIVLEDSGYLSAQPPQKTLLIPDEKKQANFELGVSMLIYKWDTLTTAVDNNWGGPQSAEKRDWLTGVVVDSFKENTEIDIIYIHELLFNAMEDEFGVIVEDESTVVIGQKVVEIYKECLEGKFDRVRAMYEHWKQRQGKEVKKVVTVEEDQLNPDVSDDDDDDDDDEEDIPELVEKMDVDEEERAPEVDEDGFTVVHRRRH
ncbi:DEKNAAC101031 [Brettanomyces naardenensis]|uniref:DEKNAAC101031 n=1 Tax=Brettanomyces naardenensis TaxID=13370 RepID=A0A448YH34_BRENA|nr:DEKNAAC101031 [Brettanomyces naardenensis]